MVRVKELTLSALPRLTVFPPPACIVRFPMLVPIDELTLFPAPLITQLVAPAFPNTAVPATTRFPCTPTDPLLLAFTVPLIVTPVTCVVAELSPPTSRLNELPLLIVTLSVLFGTYPLDQLPPLFHEMDTAPVHVRLEEPNTQFVLSAGVTSALFVAVMEATL